MPQAYRIANEDVEVAGEIVPAGAFVTVSVLSANHDERRLPDPDRFALDATVTTPTQDSRHAARATAARAGGHLSAHNAKPPCPGRRAIRVARSNTADGGTAGH